MTKITNKIYKRLPLALMLISCGTAAAQNLNSAYFTDDYKFRHDMNPAFGNEQNYVSIPMLGNISVSMQGNFGYQDVIMNNPMYGQQAGAKKMTSFMNPYISAADGLSGFSKGNNRVVGDMNFTILSAGFKAFGGYNTIELNEKTSFGVSVPYELFEFAKNTGNKSYEIGDINARVRSYAELAFGHSRKINDKLQLGAKLKFLFGVGNADITMENVRADLSGANQWTVTGKANAQVSMKGFQYKTKTSEYNIKENGTYDKVNDVDVDGAGLSGFGVGIDLGGAYKVNDNLTVSAALLDLGFISWSNNMQAVNRSESFQFNGFHDMAVKSESGATIDDQGDNYGDQIADFINLRNNGDQGGRTTALAATFNAGADYVLPCYDKLSIGLLSSTRINGSFSWTEGRLSANWKPLKWLDGGINFAVNSFTASMGYVLNIHPKGYNFFVGMDHILGSTSKEFIPLSSNASVAMGMSITW